MFLLSYDRSLLKKLQDLKAFAPCLTISEWKPSYFQGSNKRKHCKWCGSAEFNKLVNSSGCLLVLKDKGRKSNFLHFPFQPAVSIVIFSSGMTFQNIVRRDLESCRGEQEIRERVTLPPFSRKMLPQFPILSLSPSLPFPNKDSNHVKISA